MSTWNTLEEIMQDLSVAQGYTVPAALETYAATEPPASNIQQEECEYQAYYKLEGGGEGDSVEPDYEMIQQMINMVKEKKGESPPSSDLNPFTPEFVPQQLRKKINKNVAITSILSSKEEDRSTRAALFSKDIIPIMFKKKPPRDHDDMWSVTSPRSPEKGQQYTPSTLANEYYKKYVNNNLNKQQFEDDIWAGLEVKMKEIDERKKMRAKLGSPFNRGIVSLPDIACAFDVFLTEHRHLMPGDCVVCEVAAKYNYYF